MVSITSKVSTLVSTPTIPVSTLVQMNYLKIAIDKYINIGVDTSVDTSVDEKIVIDTEKTFMYHDFQPIGVDSVDKKPTFSKVMDEKTASIGGIEKSDRLR